MIPNWDERDQHEHDEWDEHYDERMNEPNSFTKKWFYTP